jgi:hypothetical protein
MFMCTQAAHAAATAGALHAFGEPVRAAAQEADLAVAGPGERQCPGQRQPVLPAQLLSLHNPAPQHGPCSSLACCCAETVCVNHLTSELDGAVEVYLDSVCADAYMRAWVRTQVMALPALQALRLHLVTYSQLQRQCTCMTRCAPWLPCAQVPASHDHLQLEPAGRSPVTLSAVSAECITTASTLALTMAAKPHARDLTEVERCSGVSSTNLPRLPCHHTTYPHKPLACVHVHADCPPGSCSSCPIQCRRDGAGGSG